jgi:diguanylate cyclase (GGDEF)-like protein
MLIAEPDRLLDESRKRGEIEVARLRLVVCLIPIALNVANALLQRLVGRHGSDTTGVHVIPLHLATVVVALAVLRVARRPGEVGRLSFVTPVIDAAMISIGIAMIGRMLPDRAVAIAFLGFPLYLLAVLATTLRFDVRVCLVAGAAGVCGYLWAVREVRVGAGFDALARLALPGDPLDANVRLLPAISIVIATLIAATVVLRTQRLSVLSTRDPLTGLLNRGYFDDRLMAEFARSARSGQPLALAVLDVDFFKRFNDDHGHAAGDEALRVLARTLAHAFRSSDLVARYGGEEFTVLLTEATPASIALRLDAARRAIAARPVPLGNGASAHITVSIGLAGMPEDGCDPASVLQAADGRLYAAKRGGRNRLVGPALPEPLQATG